eukprot:jgi/Tetstr1/464301/TSEL_009103.t1
MEDVDDGHRRFRLAYLCKHWDTQMHNGDTFAFDVVQEQYLRFGTENMGSPEFTEPGNRDNFKNARPARETAAPGTTFTKDATKADVRW